MQATQAPPKYDIKALKQFANNPSAQLKACLFNLIVYTTNPKRGAYFSSVVDLIKEQFPCRIFFIQADAETQDQIAVSIQTEEQEQANSLPYDQIFIQASKNTLEDVPLLILPHFLSDLPIYLLWGQDPTTELTVLPHFLPYANRLIFDSTCSDNLQEFSRQMNKKLAISSLPIVDMNWARISGWQEVLSQIFDSEERVEELASTIYMTIHYNRQQDPLIPHPELQAIYLQAWLASRFQWKFKKALNEEDCLTLEYSTNAHTIEIVIAPQTADSSLEGLLSIEIQCVNGVHCRVNRKDSNSVEVHASDQFQCLLPFTLSLQTLDTGRALMQQLFYQRVSHHYSEMIQLINQSQLR